MATTSSVSSSTGLGSVDGIISGLNTTDIINQLAAIKQAPITALQTQKTARQQALTAYNALSAQMLGLSTAAAALTSDDTFNARTASVSDESVLTATAAAGWATGTFSVKVASLATAQKIEGGSVADASTALGYAGALRINDKTVTVDATDTLDDLRDAINQAGAGVSASILSVSSTEQHLVLTSLATGAANAIDITDASSTGVARALGLTNATTTLKHAGTSGAAGDYLSSRTDTVAKTLGLSGNVPAGTVSINGVAVALDLGSQSLDSVAQSINASGAGVTAAVVAYHAGGTPSSTGETPVPPTTGYRLELTGSSGAPTLTDSGHVLEALGVVKQGIASEQTAAADAHVVIDGHDIYRATNDVSDAVSGVTLHLLKEAPGQTVQVNTAADDSATVKQVQAFISSFNGVMDAINSGEKFNTDDNTGGVFFGDPTIQMIQDQLHDAAMSPVTVTSGSSVTLMSQMGITTDANDHLVLDETKLQSAMHSDPEGVKRMFATRAAATNSEVQFVTAGDHTAATDAAGYSVSITQAATKATATSAHLASGITQDETLTINGTCIVSLTAGMSLDQARDAINGMLVSNGQAVAASVSGDQLSLQHSLFGSAKSFEVRSSLASGLGGTDLGGAAANAGRIYAGLDVQGTIDGEACDGYGQYLTGSGTAAHIAGLKLLVTSATAGAKGTIKVSKGLGTRIEDYSTLSTETTGTLTSATNSVQSDIDAIDEEVSRLQDSVQTYIDDMKARFTAMEEVMGQQKTISDYMTGQITALTKTSSSN